MSKIKLAAGMKAQCVINGIGTIEDCTEDGSIYPIGVDFPSHFITFTREGREHEDQANPTLKLLNIPFTEGLEVECDIFGKGVVYHVSSESNTMKYVSVRFDNDVLKSYTLDGRIGTKANQTLFPKYEI